MKRLAALIAVVVFLTGCIGPIDPPVIKWMMADNVMGLYTVEFRAGFANAGPFSLVWDTTGWVDDVLVPAVLGGESPAHDYGRAGEYLVTLTATNERGESSSSSLLVYVGENTVCYFEDADTLACLYPLTDEDWFLGLEE